MKKTLFVFIISILVSTSILAVPTANFTVRTDYETVVLNRHRISLNLGNNTRSFEKTSMFNTAFMNFQSDQTDYGDIPHEKYDHAITNISSSTIPEPLTLILFGAGLAALGLRRRK